MVEYIMRFDEDDRGRMVDVGGQRMNKELKPCPFCGSNAEIRTTYEVLNTTTRNLHSYVRCERCFAETNKFSYKNTDRTGANPIVSAIKAWNKRADMREDGEG